MRLQFTCFTHTHIHTHTYTHTHPYTHMHTHTRTHTHTHRHAHAPTHTRGCICISYETLEYDHWCWQKKSSRVRKSCQICAIYKSYGVDTISRLHKIIGLFLQNIGLFCLFCRVLLQKRPITSKEPTNHSHTIRDTCK